MDENFLYREATPEDAYGDRFSLTFDPSVSTQIEIGQPVFVSINLELDGHNVPIVPFPFAPDGTPDWSERMLPLPPQGGAICAATLVTDVDNEIDSLDIFAINQSSASHASGSSQIVNVPGNVAVRIVAMKRGLGTPSFVSVRTITAVINVVDKDIATPTEEGVGVIQATRLGNPFMQVKASILNESGTQAESQVYNIRSWPRPPKNFHINKSSISFSSSLGGNNFPEFSLINSATESFEEQDIIFFREQNEQVIDINNNRIYAFSSESVDESWLTTDKFLARISHNHPQDDPSRKIENVTARALVAIPEKFQPSAGAWAAIRKLDQVSSSIQLAYYNVDESLDFIVPGVRDSSVDRWMLLQPLRDGGVIVYATYRQQPRLLRVNSKGQVQVVGPDLITRIHTIGANSLTGEVVVTDRDDNARRGRVRFYDSSLTMVSSFDVTSSIFQSKFETINSADIQITNDGFRIWISGSSFEIVNGRKVIRGTVGFIDNNMTFHFVTGGLTLQNMVVTG